MYIKLNINVQINSLGVMLHKVSVKQRQTFGIAYSSSIRKSCWTEATYVFNSITLVLFFISLPCAPPLSPSRHHTMCKAANSKPQFILKGDWKTNQRERKHCTLFLSLFCFFWGVTASRRMARESLQMSRLKINWALVVKIKALVSRRGGSLRKVHSQKKRDQGSRFINTY